MKNSTLTNLAHQGRQRILGSTIPIFLLMFLMSFCANQAHAQDPCALVCHGSIQVSLDSATCSAEVFPYHLLQDSSQCPNGIFEVILYDQNGNVLPSSPLLTMDDLGMVTAEVHDIVSGNSCWGNILVKYEFGPSIACQDADTLDCFESITFAPVTSTNMCLDSSQVTIIRIDDPTRDSTYCDSVIMKRQGVTWIARDQDGRESRCTQDIYITRFDTANLVWPRFRTTGVNDPLICSEDYDLDNDGELDWELVGFPTYRGDTLAPGSYPQCNIDVDFEDSSLGGNSCQTKLIRRWKIVEWACLNSLSGSVAVEYNYNQLIDIVDTTGPEIVCAADFDRTTTPGECDAQLILPPASTTGGCTPVSRVDVSIPTAGIFLQNQNGGTVTLPVGTHRVIYRATNDCLLSDTCSLYVTVRDETPPVAVCDQNTIVSLTNTGTAKVHASTFNDGSHDECGIDRIEVRRMDATCGLDTDFGEYVYFNCCDLDNGPVMVVLRVYDLAGNYNECMAQVEVQDKLVPLIVCPPDITVTCEFGFAFDNLEVFGDVVQLDSFAQLNDPLLDPRDSIIIDDPAELGYTGPRFVGRDGYAQGSCNIDISFTVDTNNIDMCGQGFVWRTFRAENSSGEAAVCRQRITVVNPRPFEESDITWPQQEIEIDGACGGNVDPDLTGRPTWNVPGCGLVGLNGPVDQTFVFDDPNDPSCFKILRTWTVLDWCTHVAGTDIGRYSFTQVIKVTDSEGPVITSCEDVTICSTDPDCADAAVNVSISATDNCTDFANLQFSYQIDAFSDGTIDFTNDNNPFANAGNAKNEASGSYPIGVHTIVWSVTDGCGTFSTCSAEIRIDNCTEPKPYCLNGLSASLMPMDTDGDGTIDDGMIDIWAVDFDAASEHPCYDEVILSFSSDTSDNVRTFTCDSIGRRYVQLWVTAPNGEQAFCTSFIDIQDNSQVCPPGSGNLDGGDIAGLVSTGENEVMENVEIDLVGGDMSDMTDASGHYDFNNMPLGGTYDVIPSYNDAYLNGVTVNDLSLIQQHIIGLAPFTQPHEFFAADANNDDVIDLRDVLVLRRLILGLDTELEFVNAWEFYDASCSFISNNPLQEGCENHYMIPQFNENMTVDFTAVKIGDLDHDAVINGLIGEAEGRLARNLVLDAENEQLQPGDQYELIISSENDINLRALQLTLALNPGSATIDNIRSIGLASVTTNMNHASRGIASLVWADELQQSFDAGTPLFAITITALDAVQLSDVLSVASSITDAIGFDDQGSMGVDMTFSAKTGGEEVDATAAFELHQNRPNPFADQTIIAFDLPTASDVELSITDMSGRLILQRTQFFEAGSHEVEINKTELNANGVLYYRVATEAHAATKKMILLD